MLLANAVCATKDESPSTGGCGGTRSGKACSTLFDVLVVDALVGVPQAVDPSDGAEARPSGDNCARGCVCCCFDTSVVS